MNQFFGEFPPAETGSMPLSMLMVVVLPGSKNQQRPLLRMISWVHGWWFQKRWFSNMFHNYPWWLMIIHNYSLLLSLLLFIYIYNYIYIIHDLPTTRLPNISSGLTLVPIFLTPSRSTCSVVAQKAEDLTAVEIQRDLLYLGYPGWVGWVTLGYPGWVAGLCWWKGSFDGFFFGDLQEEYTNITI